jgi:cytochrome c biogenesis protein
MSDSVKTRSLEAPAVREQDDQGGGLLSPTEILERVWNLFISMKFGLFLILLLAIMALVGALVVQAPDGMTSDPQAYAAWLEGVRPRYGGWTGLLDTIGAFGVFNSIWFKGVAVLLVTSVVACSINRAPRLWKQTVHPRTSMSPAFYANAPYHGDADVPAEPAAAVTEVTKELKSRRFRTIVTEDAGVTSIYADRFRWAPFGTVVAHLSIVVILLGVVVGSQFGFRDEGFTVAVGSRVEVPNGSGIQVEAVSFSDQYDVNTGAPSDYASELIVWKDGQQVAQQTVRVNEPLHYGDLTFYQSFFGPAAQLKVAKADGTVVSDEGIALAFSTDDGDRRVGQLDLPDQGLTVLVVGAASGVDDPLIRPGQMQVEVYNAADTSTPVGIQLVDQGKPVTIGDLTYTFVRERQYTGLIAASDPGTPLVWLGAALLVGGMFLVFFFPNRRIWARISPAAAGTSIRVGAITRHDAAFGTDFEKLVSDTRTALGGPAAS